MIMVLDVKNPCGCGLFPCVMFLACVEAGVAVLFTVAGNGVVPMFSSLVAIKVSMEISLYTGMCNSIAGSRAESSMMPSNSLRLNVANFSLRSNNVNGKYSIPSDTAHLRIYTSAVSIVQWLHYCFCIKSMSSFISSSLSFSFSTKNFTSDEPEPPKKDSLTSFITELV